MPLPPDALARQRAAAVAVWRADVRTRPAGAAEQLRDLAVHTTGLPVRPWNGAHVTGPAPDLTAARRWFAQRGMPWGVLVPEELAFDPGTPLITTQRVMLRDLVELPPLPPVQLRWDDLDGATAVQEAAFPDGFVREFLAPKLLNDACAVVTVLTVIDGTAAATATLVVVDGTAAVFGVGTLPSYRRRGLGRAATLAVLHQARARDCDLAYLNPSDEGHPLYAALGFVDAPGWRVHEGG